MSVHEHTHGPWALDDELSIYGSDGAQIASMRNASDIGNAMLMVAAPDMLAALQSAINWFTPPNDSAPFPAKEIAAAIAKATGAA